MAEINYNLYCNLPRGSRLVIEEIVALGSKYELRTDLETEHLIGLPLNPKNLLAFNFRFGDPFAMFASTIAGVQFQNNLTLMKNMFSVAKELASLGAIPVKGEYYIGNPFLGEGVSLNCALAYKSFMIKMVAIPSAITVYTEEGVITGYERIEEALLELKNIAQPTAITESKKSLTRLLNL